jgi:hypothetical protein
VRSGDEQQENTSIEALHTTRYCQKRRIKVNEDNCFYPLFLAFSFNKIVGKNLKLLLFSGLYWLHFRMDYPVNPL